MNIELFSSKRLTFRAFKEEDFDDLYAILGNDDVCKYLPGDRAYTKEQVQKALDYFIKTFVIEKKNLHYIVRLEGSDCVVGYCGCSYIPEYKCNEIEYFLKPQFFGNGFATEMALMMKEVALELNLNHLVGLADINNIPSQKVLAKTGYKFVKLVEHWGLTLKYYELDL